MTQNCDYLSIWIQAGTAILILATFWVYFFQLWTMRKATRGQNSISIINYLQDEKVRKSREVVLEILSAKPYSDWTTDEKKEASRVCTSYDLVSILTLEQKLVPPEIIIDNWGPSIVRCYKIVEEHIIEMQKPERMGPEYWNDFVKLHRKVKDTGKFNNLI
ncbi:MAG: hypothetical protein MUO72_15145 [Bacteroidales bacterium]|nr:hypothetical protein [Bacteroidales bacterium]